MRHEAGAGHAAEGYARATGRAGVAFATSGPGATNLVTPICDAQMDSTPTLFVTGQVRTTLQGTNAFQEADVIGITAPIVKHSIAVDAADDVAQAVADGAAHRAPPAGRGRCCSTSRSTSRRRPRRATCSSAGCAATTRPAGRTARRCARPRGARRGASGPCSTPAAASCTRSAAAELRALARAADLPVTTTLMALGAFPASDPQLARDARHARDPAANWAIDEADLIVAVGARFDDRVTGALDEFAPRAKVIHIDVDPAEIDKNVPAHIPIVGDARLTLAALTGARPPAPTRPLGAWWERIDRWRAAHPPNAPRAATRSPRGGARRAPGARSAARRS